jgi:UPF0176 protein
MYQLKNKLNKEECLKLLAQETEPRVTMSFYRYAKIKHPREFRDQLYREWSQHKVFGRVYLAKEGINAQINMPESQVEAFRETLNLHDEFKDMFLNIALEHNSSFYKLQITVKKQIVADGLDGSIDPSQSGQHLSAKEFNAAIERGAHVVDMRNFYESRIGHFENAITPDCDTFEEELPMVVDILEDKKDEEVVMYCTGGIRCEKASAYLKTKGFTKVAQLKGGIINYAHQVKTQKLDCKFKGSNFVFDERISERVTDDVLSKCDVCHGSSDSYTNCANKACNLLFIQCAACSQKLDGACTPSCQSIVQLPEAERKAHYASQSSIDKKIYKSRIRPSEVIG